MALNDSEIEMLDNVINRRPDIDGIIDRASQSDPDRYARALDVAQQSNLPLPAVEGEVDELERRRRVQGIDTSAFGPQLRSYVSNIDRATVSIDDLDNLAATETELKRGSVAWQLGRIGKNVKMLGGSLTAGVSDIGSSVMDMAAVIDDVVSDVTTAPLAKYGLIDRDYLGDDAKLLRRYAARGREAATDILIPETDSKLNNAISGGMRSVPTSLYGALIGAALGNPNAGLAFMGGASGSQAFSEAREQGLSVPASFFHGSSHGMVEFATERLPMLRMFDDFGIDASLLKKVGAQMATEIPGEQVATALQDLTDWANLPENTDKSFNEYLKERPDAAMQTLVSTIVATGTQAGIIHAADRLVNGKSSDKPEVKQAQRLLASAHDQERMDALITLAQSSATNKRAREFYQEFVNKAGEDQVVYVPADIVSQLDEMPKFMADQLDGLGADIEIPMSLFMSDIAPNDDMLSILRPHLKMNEDLMSASEIEEGGDETVKNALRNAQQAVDEKTEADEIESVIYEQLKATGRVTDSEARINATLYSARAKEAAKRYGITPMEVFERMGVTVTGPAQAPSSEPSVVMTQDFGDLKITEEVEVEGTGKTVTVTQSAQRVFDRVAKRRNVMQKLKDCLAAQAAL